MRRILIVLTLAACTAASAPPDRPSRTAYPQAPAEPLRVTVVVYRG